MQPVRTLKNQFRGINPHLHSKWQEYGDWQSFHAAHTNDIMRLLNVQLRPAGYRADLEQSIQLWRSPKDSDNSRDDVVIYDTLPERSGTVLSAGADTAGALILNLAESLSIDEEGYEYTAIVITSSNEEKQGEPVAWIELLSPSNKIYYEDRRAYRHKRENLLRQGIVFIELDYLHVSPATIGLPRYYRKNKASETGATPYRIMVMNPHPTLQSGKNAVHRFNVDEPVPSVPFPLGRHDSIEFDFNAAYVRTFNEVFYGDHVDYSQLPVHFDSYSEADRARILTRMLNVIQKVQAGEKDSLEQPPQPLESLPLEIALQQYQALHP